MDRRKIKTVIVDGIEWPEEIDQPEAGEWCLYQYSTGEKCCLLGWARCSWSGNPDRQPRSGLMPSFVRFTDAIVAAVRRRGGPRFIDSFNDSSVTTDADRSSVWREAMEDCGYEVAP